MGSTVSAIRCHFLFQQTEEKKKMRKEAATQNKPDSTAILRNMMTMMKAKVRTMMRALVRIVVTMGMIISPPPPDHHDHHDQGVGLPDEERVEKETDMAKISNARDIFKQRSVEQRHHWKTFWKMIFCSSGKQSSRKEMRRQSQGRV